MPKMIGSDIPGVGTFAPNMPEHYPDRIRLTYAQARLLDPADVLRSLNTTDKGSRGTMAKRWWMWFAPADAILFATRVTPNMLGRITRAYDRQTRRRAAGPPSHYHMNRS
jgi:hypothetical protein